MPDINPDLLRQEVIELTELLRTSPDWADLRDALSIKHIAPSQVLLCSYYEDEQGNEFGLLLTSDRTFIEYERSTHAGGTPSFSAWRPRPNDAGLKSDYFTVDAALGLSDLLR